MDSNQHRLPSTEQFLSEVRAQAEQQMQSQWESVSALREEWLRLELQGRSESEQQRLRAELSPLIEKTAELHDLRNEVAGARKRNVIRMAHELGIRESIRGPYKPRLANQVTAGMRFGMLTVMHPFMYDRDVHPPHMSQQHGKYRCKCDCGNETYVHKHKLTQVKNSTKSCGCNQRKREPPKSRIGDDLWAMNPPAQAKRSIHVESPVESPITDMALIRAHNTGLVNIAGISDMTRVSETAVASALKGTSACMRETLVNQTKENSDDENSN